MIAVERHGDVTRLHLSSAAGRLVGYTVSAWVVRGVVVDTGFPRARRALAGWLDGHPVRGALVTHQHEDHAGNVPLLARRGIPLGMGAATREGLRAPDPLGFYRRAVWGEMPPLDEAGAPFADDALALLPTPGHSADHHVVWDAGTGTLFGGDLFLGVRVRIAHAHEDPRALARSLRAMLALGPARLFCAHRGPVPDPVGALRAKAEWLDGIIDAVDRRIALGWSDAAIRREVLDGESWVGVFSRGEYARLNLVRALRATAAPAPG